MNYARQRVSCIIRCCCELMILIFGFLLVNGSFTLIFLSHFLSILERALLLEKLSLFEVYSLFSLPRDQLLTFEFSTSRF